MPSPNKGESKKDYISRFMGSAEAQADFPDSSQRLAVAYSMYSKRNNSSLYGDNAPAEHPWPKAYKCSFIEPGVVFYQDLGHCKVCGEGKECVNGEGCEPTGETVLVQQDCLAKMAQTFVGRPVIDAEHKDVTPDTVANGDADGIVTRVWLDDKSGWWMCEFLVWDAETQLHCESPAFSVSCAYDPTEVDSSGGTHHNIPYSENILNGEYTHLAIVTSPRYEGARIFVNSKGGKMSWKFWEKGSRKNAAPIDPSKEMVDVDGKQVPLQNLYDALEEPKSKYNDETVLETPKGEKTLAELKQAYRNKMKANAEPAKGDELKCEACGQAKPKADNAAEPIVEPPLPDMRAPKNDALPDEEKKNAADAEAKAAEEKKNAEKAAEEKALEEKKNAEEAAAKKEKEEKENADKAAADKALEEKRNAGRRAFAALRNARSEGAEAGSISPVSIDDRLARGKAKYGSA